MADAPDLGSGGEILRGSSPLPGTSSAEANAERSTPNAELELSGVVRCSMFGVQCSMFPVCWLDLVKKSSGVRLFYLVRYEVIGGEMTKHECPAFANQPSREVRRVERLTARQANDEGIVEARIPNWCLVLGACSAHSTPVRATFRSAQALGRLPCV